MKTMIVLAFASLIAAPTFAAPCKDAKGKFTQCPTTAVAVAAAGGKVSAPDKSGRCRIETPAPNTNQKKGQFAACPK